jgi:hypothetical protein
VKFGLRDLSRLRGSLFALALMLALGTVAIVFSRETIVAARTALSTARAEGLDIAGKLRRIRGEEDEIRQKAMLFRRLQARGMIGGEQRLEWIELLRDIRDRLRLIEVRYEFAPQHALDGDRAGGFGLYASTMKLQARLLHEEDLTRLLGELRRRAPALIQVKHCEVARRKDVGDALQGLLQADCLIDWITLREAGKERI